MRLRSFARTWADLKRERREDEEAPSGPMVDWCTRIQRIRDQDAIDDAKRAIEAMKAARDG
jgi:hypothetical protein